MNIWLMNHYATDMFRDKAGRHYWFAKELEKRGHAVIVFTASTCIYQAGGVLTDDRKRIEKSDGNTSFVFVKAAAYSGNGVSRVANMLDFYSGLFPAARACTKQHGKPDVILASSVHPLTMVAGIQIAHRLKVPCICEVRDLWPESIVAYGIRRKRSIAIWALYRLEKWVYTKADAIIFTMQGGRDYIIEKGWDVPHGGPIDLKKVHHINNGVDLGTFDYNRDHWTTCDPDLDDPNLFCVVYTGSIRHVNQLSALVDVAAYFHEIGDTRIRFLIYGNGNERGRLEDECRRRGLSNIIFKGHIDRKYVPYILSKASLNLLQYGNTPILRYGASMNKSFEYLAAGKPILGSIAPQYDYIETNGCGIMRTFSTAKEYVEAILAFVNMPKGEYATICRNARETAKQYDFSVLTSKLEQVIGSL